MTSSYSLNFFEPPATPIPSRHCQNHATYMYHHPLLEYPLPTADITCELPLMYLSMAEGAVGGHLASDGARRVSDFLCVRGPTVTITVQYMWACHEWAECETPKTRRSLTVTSVRSLKEERTIHVERLGIHFGSPRTNRQ